MSKYYRVLESNASLQQEHDTSEASYGAGFDVGYYGHFMQVYGNTMEHINLPVDFLISACNQIYLDEIVYLDLLNRSIDDNGLLHLSKVTMNQKHHGYTIDNYPMNIIDQEITDGNKRRNPFDLIIDSANS